MDEKKTMARIFQWDHIMRGKVQRLDIHCPYKVWHSILNHSKMSVQDSTISQQQQ